MKVLFVPQVRSYFRELIETLFEKEYFGFEESAVLYVRELFFEIRDTLPLCHKKPAPNYFNRYGENLFYSVFKKNQRTQWYVFFSIHTQNDETTYLVRYISNNHIVSQHL